MQLYYHFINEDMLTEGKKKQHLFSMILLLQTDCTELSSQTSSLLSSTCSNIHSLVITRPDYWKIQHLSEAASMPGLTAIVASQGH